MNYFLIIFSIFLIDINLLKCSEQEPLFYEIVVRYLNQFSQIEQITKETIEKFNQTNPNLALQQQPHDRHGHFVFESANPENLYQLKFKPHEHFKSFMVQLKQPGQEPIKEIVTINDLNALPAIIVRLLSQLPHARLHSH